MEPFIIRAYRKGDEEKIITLFREVFGKELTVGQWQWKYVIPGAGKIYSKIAEDASHTIIGYAGAIPLRGIYGGRPIQFFQIADVMVHPKARGFLGKKNVFEIMIKELFEDIGKEFPDVFCYGFPGQRPFLLGKRVGVYDEIEPAVDYIKKPGISLFNPCRMRNMPWDDGRLDSLWSSLSSGMSLSLIRDKAFLNWRYASNPLHTYQLLGVYHSGDMKGWLVLKEKGEEVLVVDMLIDGNLLGNALKALQKQIPGFKKKTFRLWLPPSLRKTVIGYREEKTPVIVTNMIWKLPLATDLVRENLYYTMGDVDIF
jgi:hypothetical protein